MKLNYRSHLLKTDNEAFFEILKSTGVFYDFEIDVALEIVNTFLSDGENSGYYFYVAEQDGKVMGYVNFGSTPCTKASWDIYWIAVNKEFQNHGLGSILLKMAENKIAELGGENIWIETSSRPDYKPTRKFYIKMGYERTCELQNFYAKGDNKIIFVKHLDLEDDEID
jgi:ribosomal protein S18 acetylase RimI-like enzyme